MTDIYWCLEDSCLESLECYYTLKDLNNHLINVHINKCIKIPIKSLKNINYKLLQEIKSNHFRN